MVSLSDEQYQTLINELLFSLRLAKALENRLKEAFYYVDPISDMTKVYSLLSREIIIQSCIEIEKLSKLVYSYLTEKTWGWKNFKDVLQKYVIDYSLDNIKIVYHPILEVKAKELQPWKTMKAESVPDWWKLGYNGIKHEFVRNEYSSYQYAINALAGLFALIGMIIHLFNLTILNLIGRKGFQDMYLPSCFKEYYISIFLGDSDFY